MNRIHFIRHGLSEANLSTAVNRRKPDHAIELAPEGYLQALTAGQELVRHFTSRNDPPERIRVLISPYVRTRDTAQGVISVLAKKGFDVEQRECLQLREQSFGLFDGLTPDELHHAFPAEYAHYLKHRSFEGEFFAPMPAGESRARVCDRVREIFGSILRDFASNDANPINDVICISHGVTIRCAITEFMHYPWEWCEAEPNPGNCSITTITGRENCGWSLTRTFEGFPHPRQSEQAPQQQREQGRVTA